MQIRIIVSSALLAAALTGCGGSGKSSTATSTQTASPPSVTSTSVTAATGTALAPAPTDVPRITPPSPTANPVAPTQVPPPVDTPVPPPPPADTHVPLVAEGTRFIPVSLSAPTGRVTIVLDNRDTGILHNVNVFSGNTSIGSTSPAKGPVTETLALGTLEPGSYAFVCDVHPLAMHGVLTVGG